MIRLALGAIALHNVSKDLWDEANAYVLNFDLRSFSISLKKKNLFYAFLLRLCDEIQMWDRMHYRKPQASDKNLYGSDLNIQATKSGIYISFEEDGRFCHPENEDTSRYNILLITELRVAKDNVMIEKKQFVNNKETYLSQDFAIKICAYADQRVSPNGVLSLENRLNEAIIRYRGVENASVNSPNREALIEYAKKIEEQIFKFVHGKPEDITDAAIQNYIEELKLFNFS